MRNTCQNCGWQFEGHCHYYPPSSHLIMVQGLGGPQPQAISARAAVRPDEFCAKHVPALGGSTLDIIDV